MSENPWDRWSVINFWLRWSWKLKDESAILKAPWGDTYLHDETTLDPGELKMDVVLAVAVEGGIRQASRALGFHYGVQFSAKEDRWAALRRKLYAHNWLYHGATPWRRWTGGAVHQMQNLPRWQREYECNDFESARYRK